MENLDHKQLIDKQPVQQVGLLTEDAIPKDNLTPYLVTESDPQRIEHIPTTINPPVLFEKLVEADQDGNTSEKAVEEMDYQNHYMIQHLPGMAAPQAHEAQSMSSKMLESQRNEDFHAHYKNTGEVSDLIAGQHLLNHQGIIFPEQVASPKQIPRLLASNKQSHDHALRSSVGLQQHQQSSNMALPNHQIQADQTPTQPPTRRLQQKIGQTVARSKTVKAAKLVSSYNHSGSGVFQSHIQNRIPNKTPTMSSNKLQQLPGTSNISNTKNVDLLIIGAGPACLGFIINSIKTNRYGELLQEDGLAILDQGISFGGGQLSHYGINSNTSAIGFLKCIMRKQKASVQTTGKDAAIPSILNQNSTQLNGKNNCQRGAQKQKSGVSNKEKEKQKSQSQVPVVSQRSGAQGLSTTLKNPNLFPLDKLKPNQNSEESPKADAEIAQKQSQPNNYAEKKVLDEQVPSNLSMDILKITSPKAVNRSVSGTADQIKGSRKANSRQGSRDETALLNNLAHLISGQHTDKKPKKGKEKKGQKSQANFLHKTRSPTLVTAQNMQQSYNVKIKEDDKKDEEGIKWVQENTLTPFKELFNSNIATLMRKLNKQIVPLSVAGHLLNYVGNYILNYTYMSNQRKIFYPKHRALSVHLMGNGDVVTQALKTEFFITVDHSENTPKYIVQEGKQSVVYFRSKSVIIGAGAKQGFHPKIFEWFPNLQPEKLLPSDSFLQRSVFVQTVQKLRALKRKPRVVIIGGSHSGFSCAWLLLNGPAMYNTCMVPVDDSKGNEKTREFVRQNRVPFASRKTIKSCSACCQCLHNKPSLAVPGLKEDKNLGSVKNQPKATSMMREISPAVTHTRRLSKTIKQKKDINKPVQESLLGNPPLLSPQMPGLNKVMNLEQTKIPALTSQPAPPLKACHCICKCFGFFQYDEWPNTINQEPEKHIDLPEFGQADITILYRSRIRVFFKKAHEAIAKDYTVFNEQEKSKRKDGLVYSFSGLRGDAKQLYFDIKEGREKRVAMVRAPTIEEQRQYIEGADLVLWACGYQSNSIPIHDVNKKQLELSQKVPHTQFDVDGKSRIMLADGQVLQKCFAFGVGFPVRTKDGGKGNINPALNPRADGFSLYMNKVGEMILKSILPKRKMAALVTHKEIANPWLEKATFEELLFEGKSTKKNKKGGQLQALLKTKPLVTNSNRLHQPLGLSIIAQQAPVVQKYQINQLELPEPTGGQVSRQIILANQNDMTELSQYKTVQGASRKSKLNQDLDVIEHPELPNQTANECFSNRSFFQNEQNNRNQKNTRYSQLHNVPQIVANLQDLSEGEAEVHLPNINHSQKIDQSPTSDQDQQSKSIQEYGNAKQSPCEGAGSQTAIEMPQQQQLNEGNYQLQEENLNERDDLISEDDNFARSALSYPVNSSTANNNLTQTLHKDLNCQIQTKDKKHTQSNHSLEQSKKQSTRNQQTTTMIPSQTSKSPLLLQRKQQIVLQKDKQHPEKTSGVGEIPGKGIQEPNIIAGHHKIASINYSQPVVSEGAAQAIKKHRSQNSTGSYLDRKTEPSEQQLLKEAQHKVTSQRIRNHNMRSNNRASQMEHQQLQAVKNYIASSPYLHPNPAEHERPLFKQSNQRFIQKGKNVKKQRTADYLGSASLKNKISVINYAQRSENVQQSETKSNIASKNGYELTQFYIQQRNFSQREEPQVYQKFQSLSNVNGQASAMTPLFSDVTSSNNLALIQDQNNNSVVNAAASSTEFPPIQKKRIKDEQDLSHFSVGRKASSLHQSESLNNLIQAPRMEYRLDQPDATKSSKLSGTLRQKQPAKAKMKKQTRSITPRETYTDVMKEIAVTKAVINKMLQQDPRPKLDFGTEKKNMKSKQQKNSIRQVSSNQQLVTIKNNQLGFEEIPRDAEQAVTTTVQQPTDEQNLSQFDIAMNNLQSDPLRTATPEQFMTGEFVDVDMDSNNSYEDDLFCEATPAAPLKLRGIDAGVRDGALSLQSEDLRNRSIEKNDSKQNEGAQAYNLAPQGTPQVLTPMKQGFRGAVQAMEANKAIVLPAKNKNTMNTEKRVLKQRQGPVNQKSESAFTKVPFKREDKQKSSNSALHQQSTRTGTAKKNQTQNQKQSLISATRQEKIAQTKEQQLVQAHEMQKENLNQEYIRMVENAKNEDEMNLSESNSGRDHQVSQSSQVHKSKRMQEMHQLDGLPQNLNLTTDVYSNSLKSPTALTGLETVEPENFREKPQFAIIQSKEGTRESVSSMQGLPQQKKEKKLTANDPFAPVRQAQRQVRQKAENYSPVLKNRGESKQIMRQSFNCSAQDVRESQARSKDQRVPYKSPMRQSNTFKKSKDLKGSQTGLPFHQQTIDPKTPQRRNHNQIAKTSDLKELSEKVKKDHPFVAQDYREPDQKSTFNAPSYASVKKELRNKQKKIGQISAARRFHINAPHPSKKERNETSESTQQEHQRAVSNIRRSDQVIHSSIELIQKVRNSNIFLSNREA